MNVNIARTKIIKFIVGKGFKHDNLNMFKYKDVKVALNTICVVIITKDSYNIYGFNSKEAMKSFKHHINNIVDKKRIRLGELIIELRHDKLDISDKDRNVLVDYCLSYIDKIYKMDKETGEFHEFKGSYYSELMEMLQVDTCILKDYIDKVILGE